MNSPPTSLSSLLAQPSGHNALGSVLNGTQAGPETSSLRDQGSSRVSGPNPVQTQADDDLSTGQAALLTYLRDHCPPGSTPYASGADGVNTREEQTLSASLPRSADPSGYPPTGFDPQLSDPAIFAAADASSGASHAYEAYVDPALAALAQRDMVSADRHAAMFPVNFGGHSLHDPDAINAAMQAKADKGEMGGKRKRPILPLDQYSVSEQTTLGSLPGSSMMTEAASPEDEGSASKKTKDSKDTKVKRAEQNRKAQQAFRKRREEHIKKLEYDAAALEEVTKARDEALDRWQYLRLAWDTARIEIAALQATLVNVSRNTALHITKPDGSLYLSNSANDNERAPTERTTDTDLQVAFQILSTQAKAIAQRNQSLPDFHRSTNPHESVDGPRAHDT